MTWFRSPAHGPPPPAPVEDTEGRVAGPAIATGPLVFGLLGGMAAWMAHLCVSLALAAPVCRHGEFWLHIWDGAMTLVALAAFLVSMRGWRATRGTSRRAGGPAARSAFLALVGMLASGYSLFLIGAEAVPILFINGCR